MGADQKQRLEQELRFLQESLEADVISKEEYERGKERIDAKLKEIESQPEEPSYEPDIEIKEIRQETPKRTLNDFSEEQKEKETTIEQYDVQEGQKESSDEKEVEEKEPEEETVAQEESQEMQFSKKWIYGIAILIIVILLFFLIRGCTNSGIGNLSSNNMICSSDSDCSENNQIGTCASPGTKDSKCEFIEDQKVTLKIINDNACESCDSSRMEDVILAVFPNADITYLDYNLPETKQIITETGITALPAFIFDSNITNAANFDGFKRALIKKDDAYLVSNTASGSVYFFKRNSIPGRLEFFLTHDMEEKLTQNLGEVSELFDGKIGIKKTIVNENDKEKLSEELGITTYPSFLINNQFKFGGLQPANSIKDLFCKFNKLDECKKELNKNII
ncbi:MAG: hypothetical protein ABIE22_03330 [archaeon]|nr:gas vesicle protein GvpG [Nanoarchaeota archaeon]MBU1005638.1 gas vesicle protein GvpG [Nanoarchaeota archaeon]MBU1945843.1 gas vesicle protein GvpG [Nanoarchaeota archaeon]